MLAMVMLSSVAGVVLWWRGRGRRRHFKSSAKAGGRATELS